MTPDLLEAARLPTLYRQIFLYAGLRPPPGPPSGERFVLRCGDQPPGLFAALLEEAFVDDEAEVFCQPDDAPGQVVVRPGLPSPCPAAEGLKCAAGAGGAPLLVFAVERRDAGGRLLGVTWAAVPEGEPDPPAPLRAAVARSGDTP
jgi:hypothetical protein